MDMEQALCIYASAF